MKMPSRMKYEMLQADLQAVETRTGLYLRDPNVDRENVEFAADDESEECYAALYRAACYAAGFRAEESKQNINDLIGRVIY